MSEQIGTVIKGKAGFPKGLQRETKFLTVRPDTQLTLSGQNYSSIMHNF